MSTPHRIGKYEIVSVLGKGAMGVVYRASDPALGRHVAIKTMSGEFLQDAELRLRFLREARSAGQLQHPNIVTVHELLEEQGTAYIVMELLEGASLYSLLKKRRPLELPEKLAILYQIAGGLHHAHEHGIVHRDLKPSNVFVTRDGSVKVLDFGVAKFGEGELTRAGMVFGTLEYMAPEQVQGRSVDRRADIFALGVVSYEMLTGRNPFRAATMAASVFKILSDDPESLASQLKDIPPAVERIVFRALAKKIEERFQSLEEMGAQILMAAREAGIELRPPRLTDRDVEITRPHEPMVTTSEAPQISQWSNIAAAAGRLEQIFHAGIDCFNAGDYEVCIRNMSEVLDAVPTHSMALHYLSQSEEKLRQKKLDHHRHREAAALLSQVREAHRLGESAQVIEFSNRFLKIDPESLEARWYRRSAETRLTPARARDGSALSPRRPRTSMRDTPDVKPTLVVSAAALPASRDSNYGFWLMGGAGLLFLALVAMVWGIGGKKEEPAPHEAATRGPSPVRTSPFDEGQEGVTLYLPSAERSPTLPAVNSVLPKEIVAGEETLVRLFGRNFASKAKVVSASTGGDVEVGLTEVASTELIEVRIRPAENLTADEVSIVVVNPNGERTGRVVLKVVSR